jgi:hypothetical protein
MANRKGPAWERDFAKKLTQWFSGQNNEKYFWRSPGSGILATFNDKNPSGDIISLKNESSWVTDKLSFELKNGYSSTRLIDHLKNTKKNDILEFWTQCCNDALKANKEPVLVFKQSYGNPIIAITTNLSNCINIRDIASIVIKTNNGSLPDCEFYNLDAFLMKVQPERLKEALYGKNKKITRTQKIRKKETPDVA